MTLTRTKPLTRKTPMRSRRGKRRAQQQPVTKLAKGRECTIRTPVCTFADDQTVPCHVPDPIDSGMGHIAPELFIAWGCMACHTLCDTGQYHGVRLERDDRDLYLLRGMRRTQAVLLREGQISIGRNMSACSDKSLNQEPM